MNPAAIPDRPTAAQLREAATYLHGGRKHGALIRLAELTGTPVQSLRIYASGGRPVPRWLAASLRNLITLRLVAEATAERQAKKESA